MDAGVKSLYTTTVSGAPVCSATGVTGNRLCSTLAVPPLDEADTRAVHAGSWPAAQDRLVRHTQQRCGSVAAGHR